MPGYPMDGFGRIRVCFNVPESEKSNYIRFWLDGKQMLGLHVGARQFTVDAAPGRQEVKFVSSPRTLFTTKKVATGIQTLDFTGNTTIDIVRNGDVFEFSGQGCSSQSGSGSPSYI